MSIHNDVSNSNMVNLKIVGVLGMLCFTGWLSAHNVKMEKEVIVGDGIAKFVPKGFNLSHMPSFALKAEPQEKGMLPSNWQLYPIMEKKKGHASAYLDVPQGTSLYGGGEVYRAVVAKRTKYQNCGIQIQVHIVLIMENACISNILG